jgi:hypothetical protein
MSEWACQALKNSLHLFGILFPHARKRDGAGLAGASRRKLSEGSIPLQIV